MFSYENPNILDFILKEWKYSLMNGQQVKIIPFILKQDTDPYHKRIMKTKTYSSILAFLSLILYIGLRAFAEFAFILLILIVLLFIYLAFKISSENRQLKHDLQDKLKYFLITENKASIYYNHQLIDEYNLKEITVKPIQYLAQIYIYQINCPNLSLGDCYVAIDDSLLLKNSFTFLGRKSDDDIDEKEEEDIK